MDSVRPQREVLSRVHSHRGDVQMLIGNASQISVAVSRKVGLINSEMFFTLTPSGRRSVFLRQPFLECGAAFRISIPAKNGNTMNTQPNDSDAMTHRLVILPT